MSGAPRGWSLCTHGAHPSSSACLLPSPIPHTGGGRVLTLTEEVLRAVMVIIVVLWEVVDPKAVSFIDPWRSRGKEPCECPEGPHLRSPGLACCVCPALGRPWAWGSRRAAQARQGGRQGGRRTEEYHSAGSVPTAGSIPPLGPELLPSELRCWSPGPLWGRLALVRDSGGQLRVSGMAP